MTLLLLDDGAGGHIEIALDAMPKAEKSATPKAVKVAATIHGRIQKEKSARKANPGRHAEKAWAAACRLVLSSCRCEIGAKSIKVTDDGRAIRLKAVLGHDVASWVWPKSGVDAAVAQASFLPAVAGWTDDKTIKQARQVLGAAKGHAEPELLYQALRAIDDDVPPDLIGEILARVE